MKIVATSNFPVFSRGKERGMQKLEILLWDVQTYQRGQPVVVKGTHPPHSPCGK